MILSLVFNVFYVIFVYIYICVIYSNILATLGEALSCPPHDQLILLWLHTCTVIVTIDSQSVVWIVVAKLQIVTEESARDLRSGLRKGKQTFLCLWTVTDMKVTYPRCALFKYLPKHSATQHLYRFLRLLVSALLTSRNQTLFFIKTVLWNWSLPVGMASHSFTYVIKIIKIKYGKIWSVEMYFIMCFTTMILDIIKIKWIKMDRNEDKC